MKSKQQEILGILLFTVGLFILLSLISYHPEEEPTLSSSVSVQNWMGFLGVIVAYYLIKFGLGVLSFLFPVLMMIWGYWIFSRRTYRPLLRSTIYLFLLTLILSTALGIQAQQVGIEKGYGYSYSGLIGGVLASTFLHYTGLYGSIILLIALFLVLVRGYFAWSFYSPFLRLKERLRTRKYAKKRGMSGVQKWKKTVAKPESSVKIALEGGFDEKQPIIEEVKEEKQLPSESEEVKRIGKEEQEPEFTVEKRVEVKEGDYDQEAQKGVRRREYHLPSIELLDIPEKEHEGIEKDELVENARLLEEALLTFGVRGKVTHVAPGPIITRYEIEPDTGVRVSKIAALSDDIARVMEARSVRIVAPIPGKAVVGVEIPNRRPSMVFLRSIINSKRFISSKSKLELAIGKTTSGEIYTFDLGKMPHVLIAGATGSGKSVCINTIIMSILYKARPNEVKLVLIDPKKLELSVYKKLEGYHLISSEDLDEPIITKPNNAIVALRAIETEMEKRYDLLADAAVRNIDEYNARIEKTGANLEKLPYIVVVIDEFADLMLTSAKEVEEPIARLAQMARAVGIHLVVATQRPSVDVLTGVIKANFPARIAFQVASKVDSRTILDMNGAEKLLGRGDMLFIPPASPEAIRLHNAYVSLDEIERVLDYINTQPRAEEIALPSVKDLKEEELIIDGLTVDRDPLYDEALRLVITHQQGSASLLQRRLRIGYSRAARLLDELEKDGIVGPPVGGKAREVLVDESYLQGRNQQRGES